MHNITKFSWVALCAATLAACGSSSSDDISLEPITENVPPLLTNPAFAFGNDGVVEAASPSEEAIELLGLSDTFEFSDIILSAADGNGDQLTFTVVQTVGDAVPIEIGVVPQQAIELDDQGNPVLDDEGNTIPLFDEAGNPVNAVDGDGNLIGVPTIPELTEMMLTLTVPIVPEDGEDILLSFEVTVTDGEFSVTDTFDVLVTPPLFAPGVFDGSVDGDNPEVTEIVAIVPDADDENLFVAFYGENFPANTGSPPSNNVFEMAFSTDLESDALNIVPDSMVAGSFDLTVNPGPAGGFGFAPNIVLFAGAVMNGPTLFRPVLHSFGAMDMGGNTVFNSELDLFFGSISEMGIDINTGIELMSFDVEANFIADPTADSHVPIGDDLLLSFDYRGLQPFVASIDDDAGDPFAADNVSIPEQTDATAFITTSAGMVMNSFALFDGITADFFDPVVPPNPGAFLNVSAGSIQGAAFGSGGEDGGFAAVVSSLTNELNLQVVTSGGAVLDPMLLDDTVGNESNNVAIATLSTGQVMVVWATLPDAADGGVFDPVNPETVMVNGATIPASSIVGVVVNADGSLATEEFVITPPALGAIDPRIVPTDDDRAVVSWFAPGEGPFEDGDVVQTTLAAQIIDIPAAGVTEVSGTNVAVVPDARIDGLANGVGVEIGNGSFVLAHSNIGISILVEDEDADEGEDSISFVGAPVPDPETDDGDDS